MNQFKILEFLYLIITNNIIKKRDRKIEFKVVKKCIEFNAWRDIYFERALYRFSVFDSYTLVYFRKVILSYFLFNNYNLYDDYTKYHSTISPIFIIRNCAESYLNVYDYKLDAKEIDRIKFLYVKH